MGKILRADIFKERFQSLYGNFGIELRNAGSFGRGLFGSGKDFKRGDIVFEEPSGQSKGTIDSARSRFGAKIASLETRDAVVADMIGSIFDGKQGEQFEDWWENEYFKSSILESDPQPVYDVTFAPVCPSSVRTIRQDFAKNPRVNEVLSHTLMEPASVRKISKHHFAEIYRRILTNAVYDDGDQTVRWWMGTSLLNHSCFPNVYTSVEQPHVYRAYVDIPKGSQIFRGYILPPDIEKLARIHITCHWAQPELWEQCLCFKGGDDIPRTESELVDIYLLHLLSSESGAMTLEDVQIWDALTHAYHELQGIERTWETKHGPQTKEWFFSWKSKLRKLSWKRWFSNIYRDTSSKISGR